MHQLTQSARFAFLALFVLVANWTIGSDLVRAQSRVTSDVKFKLAQSYERAGNFDAAVKIYEEIAARDPANVIVLDALRRDYTALKRYDNAIAVIQRMLRNGPDDLGTLTELGSVYVLKSDQPKALEAWERAISIDPLHETTYRVVGTAMVQSRMFELAIALYKRGREALKDPTMFAMDIGYLYGIMMDYGDATREYLTILRQTPAQIGFVQSRIALYTGRADGLSAATAVIEDSTRADPDNLQLQQLLAWLYMEGKNFDLAYDVYKFIDAKTSANGRELYAFAERALREKAYPTAARAFQDVVTNFPKFPQLAEAKFGYARTLEESDQETTDTLKLFGRAGSPFTTSNRVDGGGSATTLFTSAIDAYNRVIKDHPSTELAARSLLRIAAIRHEKFFDLDGARMALERIENSYGSRYPSILSEAKLRLGDVYLAMGMLSKGADEYRALAGSGPAINDTKEAATLKLAELDYFQERFQDALAKLKMLTVNPSSDVTNDALSLQIFINENIQQNAEALKQFACADLLTVQHKLSEALPIFESIVTNYPNTEIVDETLLSIGDLLTHMGRFADAVVSYERLITGFPESIYIERTLMREGEVYQRGLNDKAKATAVYERLLEKFPASIYANEARRRIRELRGDNI